MDRDHEEGRLRRSVPFAALGSAAAMAAIAYGSHAGWQECLWLLAAWTVGVCCTLAVKGDGRE